VVRLRFYCVHTLNDAPRSGLATRTYRYAVLLEVGASGRFIRYERGLRYARQRVTLVRVGRCGCATPPPVFVNGAGSVGWRRVVAVCPACAVHVPGLPWPVSPGCSAACRSSRTTPPAPYEPVRRTT